ncbi:phosphotransferase [Zafaria sp. Z1313]|uniref:phosphotransferase n=1 Tax=Zafaria sp. Z1313 TaxID=3423202 RepID=UPI003D303AB5
MAVPAPRSSGWPEDRQLAFLQEHAAELIDAALAQERPAPDGLPAACPAPPLQVQLQHRPGAGISALYELPWERGGGFIGLTTEPVGPVPGTVSVEVPAGEESDAGSLTVHLWRHPDDPRLPGLALAASPERVAGHWGAEGRLEKIETVTYRPLRRAVLRAEFVLPGPLSVRRRVYLKVMRPPLAAELHHRHTLLAAAGLPVPRPLGDPVLDVVALGEAPGVPLSRSLLSDGAAGVDPAELTALLDGLPPEVLELPRRPAWSDRLRHYASAAAVALPAHEERIGRLRSRLGRLLDSTDRGPVVPSHGDFYEANLLMDGSRVSGLLDVDSVGPGHRVDDLACFLGHLAVLPAVDARYVHVPAAVERFGAAFEDGVDRRALWTRAAAVAVSLVAGARTPGTTGWEPSARARLAAAEALLERL